MLKQVCLYCDKNLGIIEERGDTTERISHGVCPDCFPRLVAGIGKPFEEFLESLTAPVVVVAEDGCIANANIRARQLLSRDLNDTEGRPGGEVFSCRYARLPEGCGGTVHCKTCTIRRSVTSTFESGKPCIRIPAYMDLGDRTGEKSIRFTITTEKVGNVVLLRIDDAQPGD